MARHDALTDLPNRLLFRERLAEALAGVGRGHKLAVLYLDLDRFKGVNDTLGHPMGDELLKVVAGRLRHCVRDTDTVARVGGDEFAIIQTGIDQPLDTAVLARRVGEAVRAPYDLAGHVVVVDTSIGIALAPARRRRAGRTAQGRRHGAVRRQGRRPRHLPLLRSRPWT